MKNNIHATRSIRSMGGKAIKIARAMHRYNIARERMGDAEELHLDVRHVSRGVIGIWETFSGAYVYYDATDLDNASDIIEGTHEPKPPFDVSNLFSYTIGEVMHE